MSGACDLFRLLPETLPAREFDTSKYVNCHAIIGNFANICAGDLVWVAGICMVAGLSLHLSLSLLFICGFVEMRWRASERR